ncbi:MAG: hypothetical protein KJO26_09345 [Deltaproteobacteria bacterium]|nr:hypothetical protein [Deltaproteobacteria bacterium]
MIYTYLRKDQVLIKDMFIKDELLKIAALNLIGGPSSNDGTTLGLREGF